LKKHYWLSAITVLLITGCAHPISITPNTAALSSETLPLNKNKRYTVGYYIPSKDKALEVTTLGGGGDNVRYYPYRDMEGGYRILLSNVFKSATAINPVDISKTQNEIDFIISPKVITTSGSTGFFTWPPTNFTVDLTSTIKNTVGEIIAEPRVIGTGVADTSERLSEHGIAGKRAMEDALVKMQKVLTEINLSGKLNSDHKLKSEESISDRLTRLNRLKENGLISDKEFLEKRQKILDSL
jgi:hypothetical protein